MEDMGVLPIFIHGNFYNRGKFIKHVNYKLFTLFCNSRELQTIHSILNEVDDGFEYIMNKLDEFEYKKYENPHKSYKKFMKDQDD